MNSDHSIANSLKFPENIIHTAPDEYTVSVDVVSIFTSISLGLALEAIIQILDEYDHGLLQLQWKTYRIIAF